MCTALSLISKQNEMFFGRTMDFSYELNPEVYIMPNNYKWHSITSSEIIENKYKFIGTGQNIGKVVFADGMNEKGLGVAVLYFPGYAYFDTEKRTSKKTLANLEIVSYLLGNCDSVDDVIHMLPSIQIIGVEDSITSTIAPLHWIVSDKSGNTITIEKTQNGMEILNNPIGVLTNSPNLSWHLTNLRNYMETSPYQLEEIKWDNFTLKPFGQAGGTFGLPGDYTSPSRFIRMAYEKSFLILPETREETLISCFHLMKTVSIPKGIVATNKGTLDYTQYTVFMNLTTGDYFFNTYENPEIRAANINDSILAQPLSLGKLKTKPFIRHI